jgi:hydroxyacylglutathione hydrolase
MDAKDRVVAPGQTPQVRIECFSLGPFETNCYVITPSPVKSGGECWIVDAGFEPGELVEFVRKGGLRPQALILTHAHVDHIAGVNEVLAAFPGLPLMINEAEEGWLADPLLNLSAMMGQSITTAGATRLLREGDELLLGEGRWRVMHTPAIVGDSLFSGSIGRTDFPGSDHETLVRSIREKLYTLPESVRIYPGHGESSTIGKERQSNPYVRLTDR